MFATWQAVSSLDRIFDDVMGSTLGAARHTRSFEPSVDVRANPDEVVLECDVPGVKQEDLEITVENQVLTIKGARRYGNKENEQVQLERAYGAFKRAFTLPDHLDAGRLEASLADGVLTLRIPKAPKAKPRKIEIAIGGGDAKKQLEK